MVALERGDELAHLRRVEAVDAPGAAVAERRSSSSRSSTVSGRPSSDGPCSRPPRPVATTVAPARTSSTATARDAPRVAPATSATCPARADVRMPAHHHSRRPVTRPSHRFGEAGRPGPRSRCSTARRASGQHEQQRLRPAPSNPQPLSDRPGRRRRRPARGRGRAGCRKARDSGQGEVPHPRGRRPARSPTVPAASIPERQARRPGRARGRSSSGSRGVTPAPPREPTMARSEAYELPRGVRRARAQGGVADHHCRSRPSQARTGPSGCSAGAHVRQGQVGDDVAHAPARAQRRRRPTLRP